MTKFKKQIGAIAAVICVLGTASISADDAEAVIPSEDFFAPVERYAITYDKPRDVAGFYLGQYGLKPRDADIDELRHPTDRSMRILFVTVDGIEGGAVTSVQWRLGMKFSEGGWQAIEAGMRRKCENGPNAGQWTKEVCP